MDVNVTTVLTTEGEALQGHREQEIEERKKIENSKPCQ